MTNGTHTLTAVLTDSGNNTITSAPINVTVNNAVTTIAITAPSPGATVSGAAVTVAATATPAPGLTIVSVQFKVDNVNQGTADTTSPYSVVVDSTKLSNGAHTLIAVVTDSSNNVVVSIPISITVNNPSTPTTTAFIAGFTPGVGRNDFSGFVGMQFTVGSAPIKVTAFGPLYLPGNTSTHVLKLVNASDGSDVPSGSVTLSLPSGTPWVSSPTLNYRIR